jgi:hypothetical protein
MMKIWKDVSLTLPSPIRYPEPDKFQENFSTVIEPKAAQLPRASFSPKHVGNTIHGFLGFP